MDDIIAERIIDALSKRFYNYNEKRKKDAVVIVSEFTTALKNQRDVQTIYIDKLEAEHEKMLIACQLIDREKRLLEAENKKLREGLEFYANQYDVFQGYPDNDLFSSVEGNITVEVHGGVAMKILKELNENRD